MKREYGFSLIELMITVAIVAILASIAYSSYSNQTQKARRSDATKSLLAAAALQERFYLSQTPNAYAGTDDIDQIGGENTESRYYSISVVNNAMSGTACPEGTCFTMIAEALANGAQAADRDCQTFTIDNLGRKRSYSADDALTQTCW